MIDSRSEKTDPALVRLVDESVPFRAASRAGDHLVAAWRSSAASSAAAAWLAIPLDRRIRLLSVVAVVAALTHIALTRFEAPEPTWWARAAWVAVVVLLAGVGLASRGIAAAWIGRTISRRDREGARA